MIFKYLLSLICFCVLLQTHYCNANQEEKIGDPVEYTYEKVKAFSQKKRKPAIAHPDIIKFFPEKNSSWKWMLLNGIYIGIPKDVKTEIIKNEINKNIEEYNLLTKLTLNQEYKIDSKNMSMPHLIKFFSGACIKITKEEKIQGIATMITSGSVPNEKLCELVIYSLTLNGISLKADIENNVLIANQKVFTKGNGAYIF